MVRPRGRVGFTFIEAMLTVAVLGILATMSAQILLQVNRYFIMSRTRLDLQREARAVMYVVTRGLRQAQSDSILIDRAATSQPFYSRITFTKIQGTTMSFNQSGADLVMTVGTKTQTLSKNVRYLAFSFPRSDQLSIVSVSLTLEGLIYEGRKKALHMASEKVRVMN